MKAATSKQKTEKILAVPELLRDLVTSSSPSGYEHQAQVVLDRFMQPVADEYRKDTMGNRLATLNVKGHPTLMFAGHMDELGLIIHYVDEHGFLFFKPIGGHDTSLMPGRRVHIFTENGIVKGVIGKKPVHHLEDDERKKVFESYKLFIDIGAKNKTEALKRVSLGDCAVYTDGCEVIAGNKVAARAFDDRVGCFVIFEALRRLKKLKPQAKVVSVATVQEEIGTRGAEPAAYAVAPDVAIAVDVGFATDTPDYAKARYGEYKLGAGPIIARGPNISPLVFKRLIECAKTKKIPYQVESEGRPTGTDARVIQTSRCGVATGLVSIPLRYMHTPCETLDLQDVENTVQLLCAFALSLDPKERFEW